MDINIKDILIYFTFALTLINIYKSLVSNKQESHETNLKETDKAFAEFVKTYASQYSEMRTKLEYAENDIESLYNAHDALVREINEVNLKLVSHTSKGGGE